MNENLKKPVKFAADFLAQFMKSKEGGFQPREIVDFLDELLQLPDVINSGDAIALEWKNRTAASIDEIINYAVAGINLSNQADQKKTVAVFYAIGAVLKLQLAFIPAPAVPVGTLPNP